MKNTMAISRANTLKAAGLPGAEHDPRRERGGDFRAGPAEAVGPDQGPDDAEGAAGGQQQSDGIEAGPRPSSRRDPGQDRRDHDQPDRDVQPEDPRPVQALGDRAADDRPGQHRDPGHAAEYP